MYNLYIKTNKSKHKLMINTRKQFLLYSKCYQNLVKGQHIVRASFILVGNSKSLFTGSYMRIHKDK